MTKAQGRRHKKLEGYYSRYREKYPGKLIKRRAKRDKSLALAKANPETWGSPSQIIMRLRNTNRKLRKATKNKSGSQ